MTINDFIAVFQECIQGNEGTKLSAHTQFRQLGNWTSMQALIVVATMDEKFGFLLEDEDLRASHTLQDLFEKAKLRHEG